MNKLTPFYRVRLLVNYEGTDFCGWQSQGPIRNKPSVQALLEAALSKIYKQPLHCVAAGRTDAGVHASGQNVHFTLPQDPRKVPLCLALRTLLPPTIVVKKAWITPLLFSALGSARAKTYRYYLFNSPSPSALTWRYTLWYPKPVQDDLLTNYAQTLVGTHDFKTFQSSGGRPPQSSVRHIYHAHWKRLKPDLLVFEITGNGFLRQMIRNLVSTQLQLQEKRERAQALKELMTAQSRFVIGKPAVPSGLFLSKVHYPPHLLSQSLEIP